MIRSCVLFFAVALTAALGAPDEMPVEQWSVFELTLSGPQEGNPFTAENLSATFTDGVHTKDVAGFYDGDGRYCVRFMPEWPGHWHYETHSNCWALTGKTGAFTVLPARGGNHGPVRVHDTFHFAYADGTAYVPIGTTTYNWLYRPPADQEQTVRTLAASPFNKDRMILLPTNGAPRPPAVAFPFVWSEQAGWDFDRFDPAYFHNLEKRLAELRDIGVEADLILFHPYGESWHYERMTAEQEDRYVAYVVARLAADRNVWWSLANEYDFIRTRQVSDWDRLFQVVVRQDPYGHLRSIHNGARLYDYRKPWITHASIQNGSAVEDVGRAELYRDVFQRPVVYDEVKYEGMISRRWGQLTPQELVHRFWAGTVAGTYVGHGEVVRGPAGTAWVAAGGTLAGESVARIAFLRRVLADAPEIDPVDRWQDTTIGGRGGEYYLVYFGRTAPATWRFRLPTAGVADGQVYRVDVLDTWAMTITPVDGEFTTKRSDRYTFADAHDRVVSLPENRPIALRIRRVGGPPPVIPNQLSSEP